MPNLTVSPKVDRLFHFSLWLRNCAFQPSINHQTSVNLAPYLINFKPFYLYIFFNLILDLFNQAPNYPSNFNIYAIKPLI
jgi:hypothetical protein